MGWVCGDSGATPGQRLLSVPLKAASPAPGTLPGRYQGVSTCSLDTRVEPRTPEKTHCEPRPPLSLSPRVTAVRKGKHRAPQETGGKGSVPGAPLRATRLMTELRPRAEKRPWPGGHRYGRWPASPAGPPPPPLPPAPRQLRHHLGDTFEQNEKVQHGTLPAEPSESSK